MKIVESRNKNAIVCNEREITYNQLLQYSSIYADFFSKDGKPEKIIIFAENSPEWIFAYWGAVRANAIVVPVDAQSTAKELAYIIKDCTPECIFTTNDKMHVIFSALEIAEDEQCRIIVPEKIPTDKLAETEITDIEYTDPEKVAAIIYTSGTTGSPKGVMLTFKNMFFNIDAVSKGVKIFKENQNTMILLPLHHTFPLLGSMLAPLHVGGTVHIAAGLNAESILKTLNQGKINLIIGVPRLYELLTNGIMQKINGSALTRGLYTFCKKVNSPKLSRIVFKTVHSKFGGHIEYLVSGGASLAPEIGEVFKVLGFTVLEGYGMTETAPMISFTRPWNVNVGIAGEPLVGIEVKIDENGEICVKGDNVMKGYYNRPEETADIIKDGWLHTGDKGILSKKGLQITGRIKDIIVTSNGKNINPEELENEILSHTSYIKEVGVFLKDSIIQCIIVPNLAELRDKSLENMENLLHEEIEKFNQTIATYKRIKKIHIYSGELPKTRLMKIQHYKLPELITEKKKVVAEDTKDHSKIYMMLKSYIDSETKANAGENDHFEIDLAMDSLSKVALLTYIESSFGISLNEAQLENLNTLGKLSSYIEEHATEISSNTEISWKDVLSSQIHINIPKTGFIQAICSHTVKVLMHICYKYRKYGNYKLPAKPCIIVANHRSALDGYFITSKLNRRIEKNTFFFAKEKHLHSKFAHFMARKNNVILMDINKNVRESLQQMAAVLKKGKNIVIFPEGTRSNSDKLLAFKDSFAILSKELNVPIIPVAIQGSERAVFNKIHLPRFFSRISVEFLQPVYPQNASVATIRDNVAREIEMTLMRHKH